MKDRKFYVVTYNDYDINYIVGVFTNKFQAEKCKEYELKLIEIKNDNYGEVVEITELECSDDIDYAAKILELEEQELQKERAKEESIKQKDLEEFNRIKEKYGL